MEYIGKPKWGRAPPWTRPNGSTRWYGAHPYGVGILIGKMATGNMGIYISGEIERGLRRARGIGVRRCNN